MVPGSAFFQEADDGMDKYSRLKIIIVNNNPSIDHIQWKENAPKFPLITRLVPAIPVTQAQSEFMFSCARKRSLKLAIGFTWTSLIF